MKHSIFEPNVKPLLFDRVDRLTADTKGKWGKLTATQMIRHLSEANRLAFAEKPLPDRSSFLTRTLFKWMFLSNIKPPGREKGKVQTFPEVDVVQLGLALEELEMEKARYKATVEHMIDAPSLQPTHTLFGKMSRNDWGHLAYAHADYHLTQFGL
ncbi:uncharacterized protein DUF1569 [Pontibacter ummariensis]|uniref:DUF1569 domain-containing protein n=1 Tax=Pontibacter ummariensis TaxID=1610492 RepID=A0A239HXI7_9BACT|nr:DUF1569 domain-containing protein [Pontibacter ummariensis]PRY10112.1 uncharacterized protein DUF1569 [Pontibacter ummariensis]SNS86110.1 Protein of unknown function [Pontibacter ummariensis]